MKNKWNNGKHRITLVLIVATLIMIGVGVLMNFRLKSLLQIYTEKQITEQARTLAALSAEQFELEIHDLESIAQRVTSDTEEMKALLDICIRDNENVTMGILCLDGTAFMGRTLNFSDFPGIQKAFRGHSAVCYKMGLGILFPALSVSVVVPLGLFLTGTVPKEIAADGISTIIALVLWVFGLLILMFAVGMVYLLSAEEKVR